MNFSMKTFGQCIQLAAITALLAISAGAAPDQSTPQVLRIVKGKSSVVTFPERIKTMSIADENIIDVITVPILVTVLIGLDFCAVCRLGVLDLPEPVRIIAFRRRPGLWRVPWIWRIHLALRRRRWTHCLLCLG